MSRSSRFIGILAIACSGSSATLVVTLGGETDTFTRAPAVTSVAVNAVDRSGGVTSLADASVDPGATIDLGNPQNDLVASIQLTGKDSTGNAVVFGATPFAELGALGGNIPLFVQRKNEFARMPGVLPEDRAAPLLAITNTDLYVVDTSLAAYDLLNLVPAGVLPPPTGQTGASFALVQLTQETASGDLGVGLWIDASGESLVGLASAVEYPKFLTADGGLPFMSWADIAGGATVMDGTGDAIVIGGTRTSAPSSDVFELFSTLDSSGNPAGNRATITPRQGAAAAWVSSVGVVLFAGDVDSNGPGLTSLDANLSEKLIGDYAADTTQGLAAIALSSSALLVAGDAQSPRSIDLQCLKGCNSMATTWGPPLPTALTSSSLFALGDGTFLIVGDDPSGATTVFRLDGKTTPTTIALKIPRNGARAIQTQTGAVLIVGGGSTTIESYVP